MGVLDQLLYFARKIKFATNEESNTAELVGSTLEGIILYEQDSLNEYIRQPGVDTYALLLTTYPTPDVGWRVLVRADETYGGKATLRQWNGTIWVNLETAVYEDDIMLSGGSTKTGAQLDEEKSNKTDIYLFPFLSFDNLDIAKVFNRAIVDIIIENANPSKFYSISNINANLTDTNQRRIVVTESNDTVGSNPKTVLSWTLNVSSLIGLSSYSQTVDGVTTTVLVNIEFLRTLTGVNYGNYYSNKYPLRQEVVSGTGCGLIISKRANDLSNANSALIIPEVKTGKFLSYDSAINNTTTFVNSAIKGITIYNPAPNKYYFLERIEKTSNTSLEIIVSVADDPGLSLNVTYEARYNINEAHSGIYVVSKKGTTASRVDVVVDYSYLNTLPSYLVSNVRIYNQNIAYSVYTEPMFPFKGFAERSTAEVFNKAIIDAKFEKTNPNKRYSITAIYTNLPAANQRRIICSESDDEFGTNATAIFYWTINLDNESGLVAKSLTGNGVTVTLLVNIEYLRSVTGFVVAGCFEKFYPLQDNILIGLGNGFLAKRGDSTLSQIQKFIPVGYHEETLEDGCKTLSFTPQSSVSRRYMEYNTQLDNARANMCAEFTVNKKGKVRLSVNTYQNPDKTPQAGSIQHYMTETSFPQLPNVPQIIALNNNYREPVSQDYVHPEIIDTGVDAIGGYRYWMIASTHPNQNANMEDELIFVSNDFQTWKRIRSAYETFDSTIHATSLVLPKQGLVNNADPMYYHLLPIPKTDMTITVDGVQRTVKTFLKHDPAMTYDATEKAIYIFLNYSFYFTDDTGSQQHVDTNQFDVCVRTKNGIDWDIVRSDGSVLALTDEDSSLQLFTQTGGKNNYMRYRKYQPQVLGLSVCRHNNQWWFFYGVNGSEISVSDTLYGVDFDVFTPSNSSLAYHPAHFSWNGNLYRWDSNGLNLFDTGTNLFNNLPVNPMFKGYKGEFDQYKKSFFINADNQGVFAVASYREPFMIVEKMPSWNHRKTSPTTIGKVTDVQAMIDNATNTKRGYYLSFEIFVQTNTGVKLYRVPMIYNTGATAWQTKNLIDILVSEGDRIFVDASVISYMDVNISVSDLIINYL